MPECGPNWLAESEQSPSFSGSERDPLGKFGSKNSILDREVVQLIDKIFVGRSTKAEHLQEWSSGGHESALIGADRVFEPLENEFELRFLGKIEIGLWPNPNTCFPASSLL